MPVIITPYRYASGGGTPNDAFIQASEDTSNASAYTFTSHAIGTANASRVVVVGIIVADTGTDNQITSVTIGGSAATMATDTSSGGVIGNMRLAAIYYRVVAAGTTATIVVNLSNGADSCGIAVWALYPSSSTPVDAVSTESGSASTLTASNVAVTAGGTMVAVTGHNNNNAISWSWNGTETVTENVDDPLGDVGDRWGASTTTIDISTSDRDLTASWTSSVNCSLAAASWGP